MNGRIPLAIAAGAAFVAVGLTALPSGGDAQSRALSLRPPASLGTFTPASADPAMAAALRRAGISSHGMRFTPSSNRDRPVTVAVRARANTPAQAQRNAEIAMASSSASGVTAITPSAYNLGVSVGWRRFAISGDVARVDNGLLPGRSRESADVGVSYTGRGWSTRVGVSADRPTAGAPSMVGNEERVALDVGGSYSIARNLDITGGVRYQRQHRLDAFTEDERRDSQAVYIGTAFRF